MRLDRAGSIRLRFGPPQIAPKIQKNVLEIRRDFKAEFLLKKVSNMSKIGSKMVTLGGVFGELLQRGSWGLIWEHFGMLWGAFWMVFGSILGRCWSDFGVVCE